MMKGLLFSSPFDRFCNPMKPLYLAVSLLVASALLLISCTSDPEVTFGSPEVITTGFEFTEGPHWLDDGSLIFSDIPANKVYRWRPGSSESDVFIDSSGRSNGIAEMPDGTIVLAQHAGRVSQVLGMPDTTEFASLATEYQGKRLNSPNDLAIRSDSVIYFTDPPFGVSEENQELDMAGVYRLDPDGSVTLMYDGFSLPNGAALSADESHLYVNDSDTGDIMRFDVLPNGDLENRVLFASVGSRTGKGAADGMTTDSEGRIYSTGPNGLQVFNSEGNEVGQVGFGQRVTNVTWGGDGETTLYLTSVADVFRVTVTK